MNKNVAALLRVDHAQLTDFCPIVPRNVKQSSVADLPAHLGVERRAIENDIYFVRFLPGRTVSTTASVSRKSYPRNLVGSTSSSPSSTLISSFFCALRARSRCSLHQFLETCNIDSEPALARHQFGEIKRKTVGVVKFEMQILPGMIYRRDIILAVWHQRRFAHCRTWLRESLSKHLDAFIQRFVKRFFFAANCFFDRLIVSRGLRERRRPSFSPRRRRV